MIITVNQCSSIDHEMVITLINIEQAGKPELRSLPTVRIIRSMP